MEFLQWDCDEVAGWIESLGFPQYKACFTENFITGRKLIYVNCIYLPRLGVTDFKDMQVPPPYLAPSNCPSALISFPEEKPPSNMMPPPPCFTKGMVGNSVRSITVIISAHVCELLGITETPWSRSIADPRRCAMALFLEQKSRTGERTDRLTYSAVPARIASVEPKCESQQ